MDSLRILFMQETNWLDRNVIHQHHLGERLAQRGHNVQVIDYDILWPSRAQNMWYMPRQVFLNVNRVIEGIRLPVTRPAMIPKPIICHLTWAAGSLAELRSVIRTARPDIVVGLSLSNSLPMALYLKKLGIPYISMVLEPYYSMVPQVWARGLARVYEALALRKAEGVVVFTPQMRQYVLGMGAAPERTYLFKTGVSLDTFHPGLNGISQREALGIEPDEWVLFFMGWLYDFSGLREIIIHLANNAYILNGARFLIVGDGDLYQELKNLIENHGLDPKVLMIGRRSYKEIPSLVAAADVCLLPSLCNDTTRDIVPMKIYEYLASGKPVVASRLPGMLAEFGSENGVLYGEGPVDVFKQALGLSDSPQDVQKMAAAGWRCAEQNADWNKTVDDFERLLYAMSQAQPGRAECTTPI